MCRACLTAPAGQRDHTSSLTEICSMQFVAVHKSAFGTKRDIPLPFCVDTCLHMSDPRADMPSVRFDGLCPLANAYSIHSVDSCCDTRGLNGV